MATTLNAKIEGYHVQPDRKIKTSALLRLFQKSAALDLENFKISDVDMHNNNVAFVLSRMTVQMYNDIYFDDVITIKTYPRNIRGAAFIRDYAVYRGDELCCYCSSSWAIINTETRRLLRPDALEKFGKLVVSDENMMELPVMRKKIDDSSLFRTYVHTVPYSQLDVNNHLNNTYYADMIFDGLEPELHSSDAQMYIEINYRSEAVLGNKLVVSYYDAGNGDIDISCHNDNKNDVCFTAYLSINGLKS